MKKLKGGNGLKHFNKIGSIIFIKIPKSSLPPVFVKRLCPFTNHEGLKCFQHGRLHVGNTHVDFVLIMCTPLCFNNVTHNTYACIHTQTQF